MDDLPVLAWDVGGVLLSNGWDTEHRAQAAVRFGLDREGLEARHQAVQDPFERGRMTMEEYLAFTIFHEPRGFTTTEIRDYIFACSTAHEETLAFAGRIAEGGRFRMVTLNNESIELNAHRLDRFGLRRWFEAFFTSGYTGLRKPDPACFAQVCAILQRAPEGIIFIDDRPENVAGAARFGMRALQYHDLSRLRRDLSSLGVEA
jgi:putative hydrolase of the HAD superfamily